MKEISQNDKQKIADLARQRELSLLVLFGSQVTGQTHSQSDVDVGYLASRPLDYRENYDLSVELAKIFENPTVELVNLENVSPVLKKQVAEHGLVLFEDRKNRFTYFSLAAHRAYLDTKPLRVYRDAFIKNFIQQHG